MRSLIFVVCSACLISGCNPRNPNPENLDPVYLDLKAEIGVAENELKTISADTLKKRATAEEVNESWRLRQKLWGDYYKALRLQTVAQERVLFLKVKLESRLKDDRLKYNEAMNEGKPWPNSQEIVFYRRNRIHRTISSDWKSARPELEKLARTMSEPSKSPK